MSICYGVRAGEAVRFLEAEAAGRRERVFGQTRSTPATADRAVGAAGGSATADRLESLVGVTIKLTAAVRALVAINGAMMRHLGTEMDRASVRDDALEKFTAGPDDAEAAALVRALVGDPLSPLAVALN